MLFENSSSWMFPWFYDHVKVTHGTLTQTVPFTCGPCPKGCLDPPTHRIKTMEDPRWFSF